jgi:hypothetical protein
MTNSHNLSFHHEFSAPQARPSPAPRLNHMKGPHQAQISPTSGTIAAGDYPNTLFLGLLTKLPVSDGAHLVELDAPDYFRQTITVVPRNVTQLCVPRPVVFEVHRLPVIAGFGLFDQLTGGSICGYGAIYSRDLSTTPVERIEVASHQLLVKRCRPSGPSTL